MGKKAFVVVGLGFGDEGKGLATDYLCSRSKNPLVIRFNGGHQAGHTVTNFNGTKHIFSNFGSGTFRNVPTYWSKFCTFSPAMVLTEYEELKTIGVRPHLLVDYLCPVTTHYDVLYNRAIEATRNQSKHGSCGLGFGTTIERSQFSALNLKTQDLHSPDIFTEKLQAIRVYYQKKIDSETNFKFEQFDHDSEDQKFCRYVQEIIDLSKSETIQFINEREIFSPNSSWETYVFEGAQGILLDMDFGFRPYVTRSNTTSKNALELLIRNFGHTLSTEIFYVTRSYQTRHGAGPFPNATVLHLINQESETNQFNEYQGEFRTSHLNINLLNYALKCDERFSAGLKKHLLITCLDQLKSGYIEYYHNNLFSKVHYEEIASMLDYLFVKQHFSFSPCSENIKATGCLKT